MRTLNTQEVANVAGAKSSISVDVNQTAKYVHVLLVTDTKTYTLFSLDWSKLPAIKPAA
jgi:hypothetical protein